MYAIWIKDFIASVKYAYTGAGRVYILAILPGVLLDYFDSQDIPDQSLDRPKETRPTRSGKRGSRVIVISDSEEAARVT